MNRWHALQLKLFEGARRLVPKLPLGFSYGVATLAADAIWLLHKPTRANIAHNQRRALGPAASEREVALSSREALRNLVKVYVDEFRLPAMTGEEIREAVIVHGLEHLEAAHAEGKGVLLTSAHFGAPHIVGQMLSVLGYPTTVVVEHVQPEELFEFVSEMRQSHGLRLIPIDKPLIGLIRTLRKENGVVALVVDRDVSGSGLRLPFFGEETNVADGAVQLALRTGSPLLVAYCRRRPDHRYEAFVEPPIPLPTKPEDMEAAVREGTAALAARMEAFIREQPDQWILTTPLWAENDPAPPAPPPNGA